MRKIGKYQVIQITDGKKQSIDILCFSKKKIAQNCADLLNKMDMTEKHYGQRIIFKVKTRGGEQMTINLLIKKLEEIQNKNGQDILVCLPDFQDPTMKNKISKIEIEVVKPHYNCFYPTKYLDTGGYASGNAFVQPYQREIKARENLKIVVIK